jgi:hypothetical protein
MSDECVEYWDGYCKGVGKGKICKHNSDSSNRFGHCPKGTNGMECLVGVFYFEDKDGKRHYHVGGIREAGIHLTNDRLAIKFEYCPFCREKIKMSWHPWIHDLADAIVSYENSGIQLDTIAKGG